MESLIPFQVQLKSAYEQVAKGRPRSERRAGLPNELWLYPHLVEKQYARYLTRHLKELYSIAEKYLKQRYPIWIEQKTRTDAIGDEMGEMARKYLEAQEELFNVNQIKGRNFIAGIFGFGSKVIKFNSTQWMKKLTSALKVKLFPPKEPWMESAVTDWSAKNLEIISNSTTTYIQKLNQVVRDSYTQGLNWKAVAGRLQLLNHQMSTTKAKMVARDQVGKLNGQVTQKRMGAAGLNTYIWATGRDERVRGNPGGLYPKAIPSHYVMEDKLCRWDDPTLWSLDNGKTWRKRDSLAPLLHPGEDFQCRCTALPNWDELGSTMDLTNAPIERGI